MRPIILFAYGLVLFTCFACAIFYHARSEKAIKIAHQAIDLAKGCETELRGVITIPK